MEQASSWCLGELYSVLSLGQFPTFYPLPFHCEISESLCRVKFLLAPPSWDSHSLAHGGGLACTKFSGCSAHLVSLERQHRQLFLGQPFLCYYLHSVWIKLVPLSLFVAWLHFCLWTTVFQLPTSVKYPVGLSPGDRRQQNHVLLSVFGLPDMHMTSPRAVNHAVWLATQGDAYCYSGSDVWAES